MDFRSTHKPSPLLELDGALLDGKQTRFSVWAPRAKQVQLQIIDVAGGQQSVAARHPMTPDESSVFSICRDDCPPGTLYRFQLDDGPGRPDPCSRFQPFGVHGPSEVIDPYAFSWTDHSWEGHPTRDLVIYELHIGSFTREGTYLAAIEKLDRLIELGINAIELLPLAQTPGRWNWGYDGVNYFAPRNTFGRPDELKQLINACHTRGLSVIHDVVYNHVGPEGNYLNEFGHYRSARFGTPWGDSLNFCGKNSHRVREFVLANVLYWLQEYRFDGLRLDAIHYVFDQSDLPIVAEIRQRFHDYARDAGRSLHLIAESNIFDPVLVGEISDPDRQYDAIWSDCLMHSLYAHARPDIRLTNRHYVADDLPEALEHGYVFSAPGAIRVERKHRTRHHPSGDRAYLESLVMALQTHDSVGNHPHGKRLHQLTDHDFQKAAAALILLYPSIPMIFMGEELATDAPFPFFADFEDEKLRQSVDQGRRDEYPHHDWDDSPLPSDPQAFLESKLLNDSPNEMSNWYHELIALRKQGRREGWLNFAGFAVSVDRATDLFCLHFSHDNGKVTVMSRLGKASDSAVKRKLDSDTEVLLESGCQRGPGHPSIELAPRSCCILRQMR